MKIYIFGAGASVGSQNPEKTITSSSRAPLVDELFNQRYRELSLYMFSQTRFNELCNEAEERKDNSVENWLGEKWERIEKINSSMVKKSEVNSFGHIVMYIWNVLRIVSNTFDENNIYALFLKNLHKKEEDFGIIDFNYDTLLDKAFKQVFNKNFGSIEDYLEDNFIKPHGSINWLLGKRENDKSVPSNNDIQLRINMAMNQFFTNGPIPIDNLRVIDPPLESLRSSDIARVWSDLGMEYFYPLIFLPLAKKQYSHIAGFQEKIIEKGKELIKEAEDIYVIGYRAKDDIIKDLLKEAQPNTNLHVISKGSSGEISKNILGWAKNLKQGSMPDDGGFAEFNRSHFKKFGEF